jgi:hypothetical protein
MPVTALGPLGAVLREAMIGFINRALEEKNLAELERVADRFARLATKGSWDFTVGYGLGLVKGVWEGIAGPFLLLKDIVSLIGNAVGWVRDLVLTALTPAGRLLVKEIKSAWETIKTEIRPAIAAFFEGPIDPKRIFTLVSGIIDEIASAARTAGAKVFDKLMGFLHQPDRKLGESIGYVTGNIVFEVTLTVLTAGGYAAKPVIQRVSRMFTKAMTKVDTLLKEVSDLYPKVKNVLNKAVDFANKNKSVKRVVDAAKKMFDKLLDLLRLSRRPKKHDVPSPADDVERKRPDHDKKDDGPDKSAELPKALAEARAIVARNEPMGTPLTPVLTQLKRLKRRYRWIRTFEAHFDIPAGRARFELIASAFRVDNYRPNPNLLRDPVFIAAVHKALGPRGMGRTRGIVFDTASGRVVKFGGEHIIRSGTTSATALAERELRQITNPVLRPEEIEALAIHLEIKLAAVMNQSAGPRNLLVVINNDTICPGASHIEARHGCLNLVPKILYNESTLWVWPLKGASAVPLPGTRQRSPSKP